MVGICKATINRMLIDSWNDSNRDIKTNENSKKLLLKEKIEINNTLA